MTTSRLMFTLVLLACGLIFIETAQAFGPTISQNGRWESISSFQIIQARINDQNEQVCLPKIEFKTSVDQETLKNQIKNGIQSQDAIFHLYHDGLGRPQKKGGMYYASDVYLKDQKITYTGYLRKLGYSFSIARGPAHEDAAFMRDVLYSQHITEQTEKQKKEAEQNKGRDKKEDKKPSSTLRVTTIFDVLPKGVIPPRIRAQQEEIARRVNALKNRPYETEIVQVDPLRWAAGRMGLLREDGVISGANVEGQKPQLRITPPEEAGWLTPEMIGELNGQPCEFVIQRYMNGLEVYENSKYLLRDIYFTDLKLSWEEWLKKHGKKHVELPVRPSFATGTVALEVKLVSGKMNSIKAPVLCQVDFAASTNLVAKEELFRVFPPDPRPANFAAFARRFNDALKNVDVDVSMLVCPDGRPYTEIGQKRAHRMYFPDHKATLNMVQQDILSGKIK